jgi:hypothetical protein
MSKRRSLAVASLCLHGVPAKSMKDNAGRLAMLPELVRLLKEHPEWHVDAVVMPGGTFRLSRALGATDLERRKAILQKEQITAPIRDALSQLDTLSPSLTFITGVLATPRNISERTEQSCLAFRHGDLLGAARKIFPTRQESRGRRFVSPFVDDFGTRSRAIALSGGSMVLLNACYDVFGVADVSSGTMARRHGIRRLLTKRGMLPIGSAGFKAQRDDCLVAVGGLIASTPLKGLVVSIHGFEQPGREGYWQRHGIARASAACGGALVVGAAHFRKGLPSPEASTLAACEVPRSHIADGAYRRANMLAPAYSAILETRMGLRGLLRIFRAPLPAGAGGTP